MSGVAEGISPRTSRDVAAGVADWPALINEAARAVSRWRGEAGVFAHESVDLAVRNAEKLLQNAVKAWESRGLALPLEKVNEVVGSWVNGARAQVNEKALKWTDPLVKTKDEVVSAATELAKPVGFGLGFGVVVVGALYLLATVRPWK